MSQTSICSYDLYPSKQTIKRIEKLIYEFIWEGKPEKIKRDILTKTYENGDLMMIDLETFIKFPKLHGSCDSWDQM